MGRSIFINRQKGTQEKCNSKRSVKIIRNLLNYQTVKSEPDLLMDVPLFSKE